MATSGIQGSFTVYNALTRSLVNTTAISSFSASTEAGGFTATLQAAAQVNGASLGVVLLLSQHGSDSQFQLVRADTFDEIAGGTGETGRAALGLSLS